jgi:hypothetical protein
MSTSAASVLSSISRTCHFRPHVSRITTHVPYILLHVPRSTPHVP